MAAGYTPPNALFGADRLRLSANATGYTANNLVRVVPELDVGEANRYSQHDATMNEDSREYNLTSDNRKKANTCDRCCSDEDETLRC